MDRKPLGVGIIGAGQIVKRHALAYRTLPELARLVAVADVDGKRAEAARRQHGFTTAYEGYEELLARDDIEVVSICTPAHTHAAIAIDSLRAGKHVLCEKPLATTLAAADSVIAAADEHPERTACCVFQLRAEPVHRRVRWLIGEGHLGRVFQARMCVRLRKSAGYFTSAPGRGSWATDGGGALINQSIHALDALISFLGEPAEVSAAFDTFVHPIEAEDTLMGWVRFAGGAIAVIECSTCAARKEYALEVVGEKAGVSLAGDPDSQRFAWRVDARKPSAGRALRATSSKTIPQPRRPQRWARAVQRVGTNLWRREWLPPQEWGHTPFIREFLEAAYAREPGPVPMLEARRSLELAAALYESAKGHCVVSLPTRDSDKERPQRQWSATLTADAARDGKGMRDAPGKRNVDKPRNRRPTDMKAGKLAIHGGRRTVYGFFPGPLTRVNKAVLLSGDLLKMMPRIARGKTTIGDGSRVIRKFENAFKRMTGSKHALAMNSGTATLHSAYFACGVGFGHEVIVPAYTWHATATPVLQCGATPVFCDIDPRTLTADPEDIERRITERTKAICVVHVWGNPAEMDRIVDIARRHDLRLIEDCSHAHGAIYKGKPVGTWGDVGCFSLNASKAVDGGEAGVAVTDDPKLFDHMLAFGHFGRIEKGQAAKTFNFGDMSLGHKFRPHQCAMTLAYSSLKRLPGLNRRCERAWRCLCEELEDVRGIRVQETLPGAVRGGYQSFVLIYEGAALGGLSCEEFVKAVQAEGAPLTLDRYSKINYTYGMLHRAPLFTTMHRPSLGGCCHDPTRPWEELVQTVSLPASERLCTQLVSLPRLDSASQRYVRACGRAMRKVLAATVPAHTQPLKPASGLEPVFQTANA